MPKCAVKKCKNNTLTKRKKHGISYFRFPRNKIQREKWRKIISQERGEKYFKPNESSVVCSDHFAESDIYCTLRGFKRIYKTAIPKIEEADTEPLYVEESSMSSELSSISITPEIIISNNLEECSQNLTPKSNIVQNFKRQKRLKKQDNNLREIIKKIKMKGLIDESLYNDLNEKTNEELFKILSELTENKKKVFAKYSPSLRKFALTLYFYSPAAYKYVRNDFSNRLPHPKCLFKCYKSVNAQPGFTEEALSKLSDKAKVSTEPLLCSLVVHEMSIRQQKIWTGKKYEGFIDMGIGSTDSDILASQALVFVLVSLQQSWTLPIAYFFIQSLGGVMKANLIRIALQKCHYVGVRIVAVTFDGRKSNISCMKSLGCDIENRDSMRTTFTHPCSGKKVAVFLDPCHMVKLIRNMLESHKYIYDANNSIKWQVVLDLYSLQEDNGLHLGNKLGIRHIHNKNQILKVTLAPPLLNNSVAQAIEFCDKQLKNHQFSHSEATVNFIKLINNLFDILNSWNFNDFGFSQPLNEDNSSKIILFCAYAKTYLLSLSTKVLCKKTIEVKTETRAINEIKTVPLHKCMSNTGIIGLLICINSLESLYSMLIETNQISYLTMHKFSQDHVEFFFGKIRSQGDHNKKPNTHQFKSAYKKLLANLDLSRKFNGNCLPLDDIFVLQTISPTQNINNTSRSYRHEDEDEENLTNSFIRNQIHQNRIENIYLSNCIHLSDMLKENCNEVTTQIIGYISGFIVHYLLKRISCDDCKNSLLATKKECFHKLIDLKYAGFCFASVSVYKICNQSERILRNYIKINGGKTIIKKDDKAFLSVEILRSLLNTNIFTDLDAYTQNHFYHIYDLSKAIIEKYIDVRMHYILEKEYLEKNETKEQGLNKLTLFQVN